MSSFASGSSPIGAARQPKSPTTSHGEATGKEPIWIPMLQSASKGKDLPEKHLIVLGGSPEQQRNFLEHMNPKEPRRRNDRRTNVAIGKTDIPMSNRYALGYTYHDILDTDQEDALARLNIHMLTNPSGKLVPLLKPLLHARTVKDTLVVVLLDWSEPFKWSRQLRQWTRLLRQLIMSLDEETKIELEECMNSWKDRKVGPDTQNPSIQESNVISLGPGEWDEGLGIPMAVVCVQSEKIQELERDLGWGDDEFDFLQQWLRTVLLKHGASLAYTATGDANHVRSLIHAMLSIQSLLKKDILKHNVIDRDRIMVPPNWDSWGKIRILREGYDPERVSNAWGIEIQEQPEDNPDFTPSKKDDIQAIIEESQDPISAVSVFESTLPNPIMASPLSPESETSTKITVTVTPLQEFLRTQQPILEQYQAEDQENLHKTTTRPGYMNNPLPLIDGNEKDPEVITSRSVSPSKPSSRVQDYQPPYQINVNGIDFDAEEATRRLRERENERIATERASDRLTSSTSRPTLTTSGISTPTFNRTRTGDIMGIAGPTTPGATDGKEKPSNEALHGFFANLIKKGQAGGGGVGGSRGTGSGTNSPAGRRASPAPGVDRRTE